MREIAECVLDLTSAADDVPGRRLFGAHSAHAGVPLPVAPFEIRHRESAGDLLLHRKNLGRIGDARAAEAVEQDVLHAAAIDRPVTLQCPGHGNVAEEIAWGGAGGEVGGGAGVAAASGREQRQEEPAIRRRLKIRLAFVIGVFEAELDRLQCAVRIVEKLLAIDIGVRLAVVVGDVMQRREIEFHLPRIVRIDVEEGHLRRSTAQVVAERRRRAELHEWLRLGIAIRLRVADVEMHDPRIVRRERSIEIAVPGLRECLAIDGVEHDAAS